MRIDAHQHFWKIGAHGYTWPTKDLSIYRDYLPDDLLPLLAAEQIDGTVLVQSQPSIEDTKFYLELANQYPFIKAVVGWVDMKAPSAIDEITELASHPKFRGLRPMLQNLPEDDWISDPALVPIIDLMVKKGLRFDALVFPRHLPHLFAFAWAHQDLPIVIDHAAKPCISQQEFSPWKEEISRLASLPNVHCKISGLVTEAASNWTIQDLAPYVAHLLATFGPRRLMWGSDWPVVNLASDYRGWNETAQALLENLTEEDKADIFGANACRFYGLLEAPRRTG